MSNNLGMKKGVGSSLETARKLVRLRGAQGTSGKKKKFPITGLSRQSMDLFRSHLKMMTLVEHKEPVPPYEGKDAPTKLRNEPPGFKYVESPTSIANSGVLMQMFKQHVYSFALTTALNMSSSGAGAVNSVVTVGSVLSGLTEFAALSGVFNEFFVRRMRLRWQPVGRYNGPLGFVAATTVSSLPIILASLQHGAPSYTSLTSATENYRAAFANTSDPFEYDWKNVENPSTETLSATTSQQTWYPVALAAGYGGQVQIISQSAPPGLPVSAVLGTYAVEYDILFRIRN